MNIRAELHQYIVKQYLKGQEPKGFDSTFDLIANGILNSLALVDLMAYIENKYSVKIGEYDIVPENFESIYALEQYINKTLADDGINNPELNVTSPTLQTQSLPPASSQRRSEPIAVVGMGCRFPGDVHTPAEFWQLLRSGRDVVAEFPTSRWNIDQHYDPDPEMLGKTYVRGGYFIDDIDQFDPEFFGIAPREAMSLDPQQRLLLEVCWETLENAGIAPGILRDSQTGVFIGGFWDDYSARGLYIDGVEQIDAYRLLSNLRGMMAGRISYTLGLQGPAMQLDTACSSSLLSIHLACQSLRAKECNLALAGGVDLNLSPERTIALSRMRALSADGRSKCFDEKADGFGQGEGCGVVALKCLSDALRDGDQIFSLIRGSAVNHDGRSNGLTVPNGLAQKALIQQAMHNADVCAEQIQYIETHGTGTPLGDPTEVSALANAMAGTRTTPLLLGSVKTNIGHLSSAAGVASFIKIVLSLQHQEVPPNLHFYEPSSRIAWQDGLFAVPTELTAWHGEPRIAGISSFGMTGTNVHMIMEEAPVAERKLATPERPWHLLTLSAKNKEALQIVAARFRDYLYDHSTTTLGDICYTASTGRNHFARRIAITASSLEQMQAKLANYVAQQIELGIQQGFMSDHQVRPQIAFLFTGQGSQYVGMGQELYETEPTFRAIIDRCDVVFQEVLGRSLLDLLYPEGGQPATSNQQPTTSNNDLMESHPCGQAANFAIECALTDLWRSWGIEPNVVLGHSLGDFAAAYTAGVIGLEDGLRLVTKRGQLMETAVGSMVSVLASEAAILPFIADVADVTIGVINGPTSIVLSGGHDSITTLTEKLQAAGFKTRKLDIPVAAHSPLLDPVLNDFEQAVRNVTLNPPQLTVISSMTGQPVTDELTDPIYWRQHLRNTVRFADGVATLHELGAELFVEIGPGATLLGIVGQVASGRLQVAGEHVTDSVNQQPTASSQQLVTLPSLRKGQSDWQQMLIGLGELYVHGIEIDWIGFDKGYARRKVTLPTYPFQRQRYWVDVQERKQATLRPLIDKRVILPRHNEIVFETEFSLETLPSLADHRVYEMVISPAAYQLAMVFNAAMLNISERAPDQKLATQDVVLRVEDLILPQALVIPDKKACTVQAVFKPTKTTPYPNTIGTESSWAAYEIEISSFDSDANSDIVNESAESKIHLTSRLAITNGETPAVADPKIALDAIRQRCDQSLDVTTFYTHMDDRQIDLGPHFRWIRSLSHNGNNPDKLETIAQLSCPEVIQTITGYQLHPGLLDACFQTAGAMQMVGRSQETSQEETLLPFAIEAFSLYQPAPSSGSKTGPSSSSSRNWWCHTIQVGPNKVDIELFDEGGHLLAAVTGFEVRSATPDAVQHKDIWHNWLYGVTWEAQPLPTVDLATEHSAWLIFADRQGVGEALATRLREQGATPILVYTDQGIEESYGQKDSHHYHIHPDQASHYEQLISHLATEDAFDSQNLQLVHLWSLDALEIQNAADLAVVSQLGCGTVLHIVQTLLSCSIQPDGLWLVTQDAQAVEAQDRVTGVAQSALWGMGKVINLEHPELNPVRVDLDAVSHDDAWVQQQATYLFAEITTHEAGHRREDQIALRGDQRFVPRLVRHHPQPIDQSGQREQGLIVQRDASYLITGGMGGIGLEVAKWFAAQGAAHLILMGRSQPKPAVQTVLDELTAQGVAITVAQADVTDYAQVEDILAQINPAHPLKGIVHSVGVLADGLLYQQDWERFAKVLAPKVQGAWHLHEATKEQSLDFFVLFSSVASLLGNQGQANHAAANAFLDSFAHVRKAQGYPTLSIHWGAWSEVGAAAELVEQDQIAAKGIGHITPVQGIETFAYLLGQDITEIGVSPIIWPRYLRQFQQTSPFYGQFSEAIASRTRDMSTDPSHSAYQKLAQADSENRPTLLVEHLQKMVATILGINNAVEIDPTYGLLQMGLDSLMAIELRSQIQRQYTIELPITLFLEHLPITELTKQILEKFNAIEHHRAELNDGANHHPAHSQNTMVQTDVTPRLDNVPLTLTQHRMWLRHKSNPNYIGNSNSTFRFDIAGALDVLALERSFEHIIARHDVFRTTFPEVNGVPRLAASATSPIEMVKVDWSGRSKVEQSDELERLTRTEIQEKRFDLANGPLLRIILIQLGPELHHLLFTMHHILVDAWSLNLLLQELSALYQSFAANKPLPTLPMLSMTYVDYAQNVHQTMTPEFLGENLTYWRQWAAEEPPGLTLPIDRPRSEAKNFHGKAIPFRFPAPLILSLRALARESQVTLFTAVQATIVTWLHSYSRQDKITIGMPFANRTQQEIEPMIGQFNKLLIPRMDIGGNPTFQEFLPRVRNAINETIDQQQVPFEQFAETLQAERTRSDMLFRALVSILPGTPSSLSLSDLTVTSLEHSDVMLRPDIALMIWEEKGLEPCLAGWMEYRTELFEADSAKRMLADFQSLLEVIVADPTQPIAQICDQILL